MATIIPIHEKCNADEIFVGNHSMIDKTFLKELKQRNIQFRLGNVAYDINGKKLKGTHYRPLFIKIGQSFNEFNRFMTNTFRG